MKVLKSKVSGGLYFSKEILDWLRKYRYSLDYKIDEELMKAIEDEDILKLEGTPKFRSHPIIIAAFKNDPNTVVEEIPGDFYVISKNSLGIEEVLIPVKGYDQENSKALLIDKNKNTMEITVERLNLGVRLEVGDDSQLIKAKTAEIVKSDMTVRELKLGQKLTIKATGVKQVGEHNFVFEDAHMSLRIGE